MASDLDDDDDDPEIGETVKNKSCILPLFLRFQKFDSRLDIKDRVSYAFIQVFVVVVIVVRTGKVLFYKFNCFKSKILD